MSWSLQLHGLTDHLPAEQARELEEALVVKAHELFAGLVPDGHQGVAGIFTGDHTGAVNLVDATAPPEGTPAPDEGVKADGSVEPAPTEPPPTFVNGEVGDQQAPPSDPQTEPQ